MIFDIYYSYNKFYYYRNTFYNTFINTSSQSIITVRGLHWEAVPIGRVTPRGVAKPHTTVFSHFG